MSIVLWGLGLLGPVLLVAAPWYLASRLRFHRRAEPATGTVTACELEKQREPGTPWTYRVTVGYRDPAGGAHTVTGTGMRRDLPVGTVVPVRYDPRRPEHAALDAGPRAAWQLAVFLFLCGVLGSALLAERILG